MSNITEKDIKLFYEMLERDKNSAHFLWDCAAGTVVSAGSGIFADVSGDPLEYLRESGLIDPQSLPSFNIFSSCIEEGTISGSDRMSLAADIRMKLSADGEFRLCGFYAHFLKDDGGRIIAVHGTIRPYTSRELFDRRVLSGFSSDRDPRIFSDEAAEMIKRHPNEEIAFIQFDVERFKKPVRLLPRLSFQPVGAFLPRGGQRHYRLPLVELVLAADYVSVVLQLRQGFGHALRAYLEHLRQPLLHHFAVSSYRQQYPLALQQRVLPAEELAVPRRYLPAQPREPVMYQPCELLVYVRHQFTPSGSF